ncbi:MAG TPA: hypothetical protein VIW68_04745 [Candidatus Sulfotelmatobacter sp.]
MAFGQDFTMTVTQPNPPAVDQGQDSRAYIDLGSVNGFSGTVSLSCAVTPVVMDGPVCTPPATGTPPQQLAMSITVGSTTPAGFYTLTVNGTGPAPSTPKTTTISLSVLAVTSAYTLAVTTSIVPTSVHAGFPAVATVTVSAIGSYQGTVTLSCSTITPLATPAPSCSFSPPAVTIPTDNAQSTLTITTTGNTAPPPPSSAGLLVGPNGINGPSPHRPALNSTWLAFSALGMLAIVLGTTGRRRRKLCGLSLLFLTVASLLLMPACTPPNNSNTGQNGSTPKNTYVFTLTGADVNGVAPGNEATPPTVSLIVD